MEHWNEDSDTCLYARKIEGTLEPATSSPFPEDAAERKTYPVFSGCLSYFPNALAAVAKCSYDGNQQHHPDEPLHWDKSKSTDEADALIRHLIEGEYDKVAWRALALCERSMTGTL